MTFNVLGAANPDWERRSRVIGSALRALEADVVALQEVNVRGGVEDLLGPGYCVTAFLASSEDGTGAALATRAEHRVLEEIDMAISRRIDYVLVRAGRHGALLQVLRCDRLLDGPVDSVWASDHYGVVADLGVPQHPPGTWTSDPQHRE